MPTVFVTELVTSSSSCNTSEVSHTGIFSELSESLDQEGDTPGYIISLKKCHVTLNSICHDKVYASHWHYLDIRNPNTVSEREVIRKRKKEKENKNERENENKRQQQNLI